MTRVLLAVGLLALGVVPVPAQERYEVTPGPLVRLDDVQALDLVRVTLGRPYRGARGELEGGLLVELEFVANAGVTCAKAPGRPGKCQRVIVQLTGGRARAVQNIINKCTTSGPAACDYGPDSTLWKALYRLPEFRDAVPGGSVGGDAELPTPRE